MLHLQHGECGSGIIGPQADLPPQLQAVDLPLIVRLPQRVKIEGADGIALGPVVGILEHDLFQTPGQDLHVDLCHPIFLFLPKNFVH